jgi:hypothetical protein
VFIAADSKAAFAIWITKFCVKTQFETCFILKRYQVQYSTGQWDILTRFFVIFFSSTTLVRLGHQKLPYFPENLQVIIILLFLAMLSYLNSLYRLFNYALKLNMLVAKPKGFCVPKSTVPACFM